MLYIHSYNWVNCVTNSLSCLSFFLFVSVLPSGLVQSYAKPTMKLLVLLSVLWAVVYTQTFPYVSFMGQTLANHSYVTLSVVGDEGSHTVQCNTDLSTCCSGAQGPHRGDWYFPDENRLPFAGNAFEIRRDQGVDLVVEGEGSLTQGVYRCDIPTIAFHGDDDISVRDTVYVGLYSEGV